MQVQALVNNSGRVARTINEVTCYCSTTKSSNRAPKLVERMALVCRGSNFERCLLMKG